MIKRIVTFLFIYFVLTISVDAYTSYKQGDIVNYNGIDFYVLYDSLENSNVLTLLKKEPLTVEEINKYGVGHINNYSMYSENQVYDYNDSGYGRIVYYSSEHCGLVSGENIFDDCKFDYESSDVKYVVDAWGLDKLNEKDLWKDNLGYSYRLITKEEIIEYMNYSLYYEYNFSYVPKSKTPSWIYNEKYYYFTMSNINRINNYGSLEIGVYCVSDDGTLYPSGNTTYVTPGAIRPVILLRKKALEKNNSGSNNEVIIDNKNNYETNNSKNSSTNKSAVGKEAIVVPVADTFTKISILSIALGICLICMATTIYLYNIKKEVKNEKDS